MLRAAEQLPDGPVIMIANHTSTADGFLLALVARRMGRNVRLLATAGVFRIPVVGRAARMVGFIPVQRGTAQAADSLEAAVEALAAGEVIGLFPEGRITRHGDHWPERARTGAIRLALRSGAPIVPVAFVGAHRVVARRRMVSRLMLNVLLRPQVRSKVGEPIDVGLMFDGPDGLDDPLALRSAADTVMAILVDLVEDVRGEIAPDPLGVVPDAR